MELLLPTTSLNWFWNTYLINKHANESLLNIKIAGDCNLNAQSFTYFKGECFLKNVLLTFNEKLEEPEPEVSEYSFPVPYNAE
jgi:hypothetical protein